MNRQFLSRGVAIVLLLLGAAAMLTLRVASSPTAGGYRPAIAPAPQGIYLAGRSGELVEIDTAGQRRIGRLPTRRSLALARNGPRLLLGAEDGLFLSPDGGLTWSTARPGRFTAVALDGNRAAAGAWGGGLWTSGNGGSSWSLASVPAGDTEFEAIVLGPVADLASTELGLLRSVDGGNSWRRLSGLPGRMTAISQGAGTIQAGTWEGDLFESSDGEAWRTRPGLAGGIWTIAGDWTGTSDGLYEGGRRTEGPLAHREVTQLVMGSDALYAAVAQGPIYTLGSTGWRPVAQL